MSVVAFLNLDQSNLIASGGICSSYGNAWTYCTPKKEKEKKKKEHELSWPLGLNLSSGPTHSNPDFEPCKAQAWDNLPTPSQTAKETRKNSNETPQL